MKRFLTKSYAPVMLFTIVVVALIAILNPRFISWDNILLVFSQSSTIMLLSVGMTMVVILGGMDLSVGAVVSLSASLCAVMMRLDYDVTLSVICGLAAAVFCGVINGFATTRFRAPDIICTLATSYIFRSIALLVVGDMWLNLFPSEFDWYGKSSVLGLPFPFVVGIICALLIAYMLGQTLLGRKIYACGGNLEAARLTGIRYRNVKMIVYIINGLFSGMAAIMYLSKVGFCNPSSMATTFSNDVLAAVLIGGASITGGIGSVLGSVVAAILVSMLKNALTLLHVSAYWVDAISGMLIIMAIFITTFQQKKRQEIQDRGLV